MAAHQKGWGMLRWEHDHGKDAEEEIRHLYSELGHTQRGVAERMGVHHITLHRWMKQLAIPARRPIWVDEPLEAVS